MFSLHSVIPSVSVYSPDGLKIILKFIDPKYFQTVQWPLHSQEALGLNQRPLVEFGCSPCAYMGPIIHPTANVHNICPALLNHCKIQSFFPIWLKQKESQCQKADFPPHVATCGTDITEHTQLLLMYHFLLCCTTEHYKSEYLCGPSAVQTHLFFSLLTADSMQFDFFIFLFPLF